MHADLPVDVTDHRAGGVLEIAWSDGAVSRLSHRMLRQHCRCAACEQLRRRGPGVAPSDDTLRLRGIEAVGALGLSLAFSDGHDRGIYPWPYLRALGAAANAAPTPSPTPTLESTPCPTPASNGC